MTTGWTTGVRFPTGIDFSFLHSVQTALWGSPSFLSNGYRGLFRRGVTRPGRESDHSPPQQSCTSTPPRMHGIALSELCIGTS
jgi:hypothetical protein